MSRELFLFDTHALIFWSIQDSVGEEFIAFFDAEVEKGNVFVSSISFWEAAFLAKKKRIAISDIEKWKNQLLENANLQLLEPSASEMIKSMHLPDYHGDPFDRLLVVQASAKGASLVSRDTALEQYKIKLFWI